MTFRQPALLALIVAPLAIAGVYIAMQFARSKYTLRFTSVDLLDSVAPRRPGWQRHVSALLMLFALGALVVGLARPARTSRVPKPRGTIMMAIDTSGSMAASDVAPTRLKAAETAARNFVNTVPKGLKIGLLQFDNTARTLVAPTDDHLVLTNAIDNLTIGGGTSTASAISQSLATIAAQPPDTHGKVPAAIVLMSDGSPTIGENGLEPVEAVTAATSAAKTAGVPIDTIAFGTDHGVVSSANGEQIPVPADPGEMGKIASGSGGKSFTAKSGSELNSIYAHIRNSVGYDTVKHDITVWFLALGFMLLLATSAAGLYWMQRIP